MTGENDLPLLFRFQISWFLNTNTNIEELELFDPLVSNRILIRITLKNKIPSRMYKTSVAGNQIYNLKSEWAQSLGNNWAGYFENAPNFVNFFCFFVRRLYALSVRENHQDPRPGLASKATSVESSI